MPGLRWAITVMMAFILMAGEAAAQGVLGAGKSQADVFKSDCAECHKSPQGLVKNTRMFGLAGFLREHYTISREAAQAMATYLEAVDRATPAAPARPARRPAPKPDDKSKPADAKPTDAKPGEAKPADKPAETKPADAKPADSKPADSKPPESKPEEPKPAAPPSEPKPAGPNDNRG